MSPTRKISLIVLPTIAFAAFLTWAIFRGQINSSQPPSAPTNAPDKHLTLNIPQKALWRNYVTVSAKTTPGTTCELIYVPPDGKALQMNTTANSGGLCEWKWKIDETQGKGNGRLIFTIDGISETHFMEIRSAF